MTFSSLLSPVFGQHPQVGTSVPMLKMTLKTSFSTWLLRHIYGPFTHKGREAEELNLRGQKFSTASAKMKGVLTSK